MTPYAAPHPLELIATWAIPLLFAITVHEAAHGMIAYWLGDPTAKWEKRLTLNPVNHIDWLGTILLPGLLIATGASFLFGWAKPVPVNPQYFKKPSRDMAWVAAAGPGSNFIMGMIWAYLFTWGVTSGLGAEADGWSRALQAMGKAGIQINASLCLLNLLPIPPLDGSRIIRHFSPPRVQRFWDTIEPYGIWILLLAVSTGLINQLLFPAYKALIALWIHWMV